MNTTTETTSKPTKELVSLWTHPPVIAKNGFTHKSLCDWSYNVAVGCNHGCRFCYVPSASTNRMGDKLGELYGVTDPDGEWGQYVFVRKFDKHAFLASVKTATNQTKLTFDGNRAVMLCTTTDPYQVLFHKDADRRILLNETLSESVRQALLILQFTDLNVRILTRSPLAARDFDVMKAFGPRLLFGMSLPTLNNKLAKVYEPDAPAPSARLRCLQQAKEEGLNVYVAMAPTYPECDDADLAATLEAIKELKPVTVFHEPINIRADNVARISAHGATLGIKMKTEVFATKESWQEYAIGQLLRVESIGRDKKLPIHPWPDASLGTQAAFASRKPVYRHWIEQCWKRVSEWPTVTV